MDVISSASGGGGGGGGGHSGGGKSARRAARGQKKRKLDQRFSDYIWFSYSTTVCLGIFLVCYALVLIVLWPLLVAESPSQDSQQQQQQHIVELPKEDGHGHGHYLHLPQALQQVAQHDKEIVSGMAGAVKQRLQQLRQGRGTTDAALLDQATLEFEQRKQQKKKALDAQNAKQQAAQYVNQAAVVGTDHRQGFVVLGMHRSGTSMLSGLLHKSCGYEVGGPLIGAAFDNEKGFYERVDVVLQNDEFMRTQGVSWAANVINYDWEQALKDKEDGTISFTKGKKGLEFLNNPKNAPWLQKDPRMCITLKTWLKLLNSEPAVVFTYRHPLEVAISLNRREQNFALDRGLRLWIVYNMRAVQNSQGLCVVRSSNAATLANPLSEIQRISDELTSNCNVPEPPYRLTQEDVDKFIDPSLQHNENKRALDEVNKEVITSYYGGKCVVYAYESSEEEGSHARQRETTLYAIAMKIYCDFQSGKAYEEDYVWPVLP